MPRESGGTAPPSRGAETAASSTSAGNVTASQRIEFAFSRATQALIIRCQARDSLADYECVNIVRALVGLHGFQIAHVPEDWVFIRNAVGPEQIAAAAGRFEGHPHIVAFEHRYMREVRFALILQAPYVQRQKLSFGNLRDHPGQLALDQLVAGNRSVVKLLAQDGILARRLVASHRRADGPPTDPVPRLRQTGKRTLQARGARKDARVWDPAVMEGKA